MTPRWRAAEAVVALKPGADADVPDVVLENEAVQALARVGHAEHRRVRAVVEALAGRRRRGAPTAGCLVIPAAVQVEAGWDRRAPASAPLNRLRADRPALDGPAADRAAALVAKHGISVADAHVGAVRADRPGPHVVLTSDPGDIERVLTDVGAEARVVPV